MSNDLNNSKKNIKINIKKVKKNDDDGDDIDEIDYTEIKLNKRKRSNSENDIYYSKIIDRSKNDDYFKKQIKEKQIEILNKENDIYNYFYTGGPLRYKILYSSLPISTKFLIIQKIDIFENMDNNDNEYYKLSRWLNGIEQIRTRPRR